MDKELLKGMLIEEEGLRLKPYKDSVGKLTIGVGRNLADRGINQDEAFMMLDRDMNEHYAELLTHLPWVAKLDEVRQRVLADMAFNMGIGNERRGLLSFSTTLRLIENDDYETAADNMLRSDWAQQTGRRARRLSAMMRDGQEHPL